MALKASRHQRLSHRIQGKVIILSSWTYCSDPYEGLNFISRFLTIVPTNPSFLNLKNAVDLLIEQWSVYSSKIDQTACNATITFTRLEWWWWWTPMILVLADRHSVVGKVQSSHSAAGTAVHILSVWTESDFGDHSIHHRLHWWHPSCMWYGELSVELGKVVVTAQSQGAM